MMATTTVSFMMCSCFRTSTNSCCQNKLLKIHFYSSSIQPKLSTLANRVFPWFIATSLPYTHLTDPSSSHSTSLWYCFSCPSSCGSTFMLKPSGNGTQLPRVEIPISDSSRQGWESIMDERSRRTLGARGGK